MCVAWHGRAVGMVAVLWAAACVDATPPADDRTAAAFRRLTAQLDSEHFRGSIYPALPGPGKLLLSVRDPYGRLAPTAPAESLATVLAQRALALFVPPPSRPTPIEEVEIALRVTHRLGPFIWTTSLGTYRLTAKHLRALPPPARDTSHHPLPFPLNTPAIRPSPGTPRDSVRSPESAR